MDVEEFDPGTASEAELRQWYDVDSVVEREHRPDAVSPYEESVAFVLHPTTEVQRHWVGRHDGEIVAVARTSWWRNNTSQRNADITVTVRPDARRRGVGTTLARVALAYCESVGRDLAGAGIPLDHPDEAFAARLGARRKMVERMSTLYLDEIDRELLLGWVRDASAGAVDYDLVSWRGATPDEWLDEYCRVSAAINDAPKEDLDIGDETFDPAQLQEWERVIARRRQEFWTVCARHVPTNRLAGVTQVLLTDNWPEHAYQENTAVEPRHRGHGLGRWMKARMALDLLDHQPQLRRIDTWNAGSNQWMLAINVEMGFRPTMEWGIWQVATSEALRALAA